MEESNSFYNIEDEYEEKYDSFVNQLSKTGWMWVGGGSFRRVWGRNNHVVKIPRNNDGELDNIMEFKAWRKYRNKPTSLGLFLAPCRLLQNNCLLMANVDVDSGAEIELPWQHPTDPNLNLLDKDQAGIYKGRVVAYDYALDLQERLSWEEELEVYNSFFQQKWVIYRPHLLENIMMN